MKSLTKAIAIASLATVATAAQAELSTTVGVMTDYVFRGDKVDAGVGYASIDFEEAGFYAGVWGADIESGLEVDFYLGYAGEIEGFEYGLGYTRYEYTDNEAIGDNAESQDEIILDLGMAGISFQYVYGVNNDVGPDATEENQDYSIYTLAYSTDTWSVLIGQTDVDDVDESATGESEYNWAEFSASQEVASFDITATIGVQFNKEEDGVDVDSNDGYITLDISKSFDL